MLTASTLVRLALISGLARNITQFTLLGEPLVREAEKMGFRDLIDIGSLKIPYHVNSVVTRESTIKSRRPLVATTACKAA